MGEGRDWVGPLIGVAVLGGMAYLGYNWYMANKCDVVGATTRDSAGNCKECKSLLGVVNIWQGSNNCNPDPTTTCHSGQTRCSGGVSQICACDNNGANCAYTSGGGLNCQAEDLCYVKDCPSTRCEPGTYNYQVSASPRCAVINGVATCQYTTTSPNDVRCRIRTPESAVIYVDGIPITGSQARVVALAPNPSEDECGWVPGPFLIPVPVYRPHAIRGTLKFEVRDQWGALLPEMDVYVSTSTSDGSGNFALLYPDSSSKGGKRLFNCSSGKELALTTGSDGAASVEYMTTGYSGRDNIYYVHLVVPDPYGQNADITITGAITNGNKATLTGRTCQSYDYDWSDC